jgi:hypothetical protein
MSQNLNHVLSFGILPGKPNSPPPPSPMPDPNDPQAKNAAMKRTIRAAASAGGRDSTILSPTNDKLGG